MEFPSHHMQLMYCYVHTNLLYSVALYMNVIYLNLIRCKVHHLLSGAVTLGQIVANIPSGLSLTPPQEIKKKGEWLSLTKER
jgi:hypothetical protein